VGKGKTKPFEEIKPKTGKISIFSARKNVDDLKNSLESVVIPMYCHATMSKSVKAIKFPSTCSTSCRRQRGAERQAKQTLDVVVIEGKLLRLVCHHQATIAAFITPGIPKYASDSIRFRHHSPQPSYEGEIRQVIRRIIESHKVHQTLVFSNSYQQQHQAFAKHAANQITILEAEKQKLEQQSLNQAHHIPDLGQNPQQVQQLMMNNLMIPQQQQQQNLMFNIQNFQNQQQNFQPPPQQQQQQQDMNNQFQNFNLPPPNFPVPDFSRPPPGFNNSSAENSPPQAEPIEEPDPQPFFTLPAGLMVPLIELESCSYRGLDPDRIRIPLVSAPTEKLLNAVEAFYAPPSHERPRDTEGWEKLGLYEYFKVKNAVRKQKEESVMKGEREKTKSPSPIPEAFMKSTKKQKKRVYRSKSPEGRISRSKSRSKSPELRPSLTPTSSSRSRNRKRSPSPTPYRHFNRDRIDRRKRSVTPPSFMGAAAKTANEFIDEGNKGHQMLKKLGWTSGGLGSGKNQGISEPISGGEVRDRNELYKVSFIDLSRTFFATSFPFRASEWARSQPIPTRTSERIEATTSSFE
jgi:hypothetical protein